MRPIRAFILDDEPLAVARVRRALAEFSEVRLVGSAANARAALSQIASVAPDVIFLDIKMPGLGGFEVVEHLSGDHAPLVVFVTAHQDYAAEAFNISAIDYLLKPFSQERLAAALAKVRAALISRDRTAADPQSGRQPKPQVEARPVEESFWAVSHRERIRVPVRDIVWVEAEGDYVRFHLQGGGRERIARATLNDIQSKLDPDLFVRIHRSVVVRRSSILTVRRNPTGSMSARLHTGDDIPVGRSYLRALPRLVHGRF